MSITNEQLSIFKIESDLRQYLKVNGYRGTAVEDIVAQWKNPPTKEKNINSEYNTSLDTTNETTKS